MNSKKASSSGKIIISGDHSVVYGHPAIAIPVPLRTTVEIVDSGRDKMSETVHRIIEIVKNVFPKVQTDIGLKITSTLPQNSGLGSSAALSHALARALCAHVGYQPTQDQLFSVVQDCEKIFHGNPSGVDAATVVYEACIRFQKKHDAVDIQKIDGLSVIPEFVLIDSGKAKESTKEMVEMVRANRQNENILKEIGGITRRIEKNFQREMFDIHLVSANERLLEQLGVVGKKAQAIIQKIESIGGYAKVTGAGGIQEGSGSIIAFHSDLQVIRSLSI